MEELGKKIAETIIEQSAKIIGLYPGSFKVPHKGHFEVAKRASQHVDELHIIISNNIREGYTPEVSLKVWKQYQKLLPENVKVRVSKSNSPITEIYSIVKDKTNNYLVIYGKGEKDRYNSVNENRDKYSNVDVIDAGNFNDISATSLREAIKTRNKLAIKSLIPEGIKVDDFLMNFQIHEIKVNTPGSKSVGDVINLIKQIREKYRTLQSNDQLYYINKIEDIKDKYGDVIAFRNTKEFLEALPEQELNKIYKEYQSLYDLNEIKINQPVDFKKLKSRMQEFFKYATKTLFPPQFSTKYDGRYDSYIERINNASIPEDLYSVIKDMHKAQGLGDGDALDFIELLKSGKENFWLINEIKINNPTTLTFPIDIKSYNEAQRVGNLLKQQGYKYPSGRLINPTISPFGNKDDEDASFIPFNLDDMGDKTIIWDRIEEPIDEIKVNTPGWNFPLKAKNAKEAARIVDELIRQDYRWMDGSKLNLRDFGDNYSLVLKYNIINPEDKKISYGFELDEEKIPGGLASGLTLQDIADKHKVNISSLRKQLQKGIKVELEHTTSKDVAEEIAMDHLFEDPKYYDKLATIETDTVDEIKINKPGIDLKTFKDKIRSKDQKEVMELFMNYNWVTPYTISSFFDSLSNDNKSEVYNKMSSLKDRIREIKVNKPGILPYEDFQSLIHSVKDQSRFSDVLERNGYDMISDSIPRFYDRIKDTPTLHKLVSIMNGMEKRAPRRVDEAKNVGDIYHFTNLDGLKKILDSNSLKSSVTEVDKYNPDFKSFRRKESDYKDKGIEDVNYISTTRNRDFWKKNPAIVGSTARIILDGNKLSNTYKINPFSYYSSTEQPKVEKDESEERIDLGTKNGIPVISNYIKEIDILLDKVGDNMRIIKLIQELQTKYPQVKTLYKDKEMSVDQYISDILPTVEPYHGVDEIKVNKPGLKFPEYKSWVYILKDEEEYEKIYAFLNKMGWTNGSKYDFNTYNSGGEYTILFSVNPESNNKKYMLSSSRLGNEGDKSLVLNPEMLKPLNESKLLKEVFSKQHAPILDKAVKWGCEYLDVPRPVITLINNPEYTSKHHSFGGYSPSDKSIKVVVHNRNLADLTRSLFHEMVHLKQDEEGRLTPESGQDGDEWENEANSTAGDMMRKFSRENPEIFE